MQNSPLIVTAKMDAESFEFLNALRKEYFPVERNHLSAHITLFHHLPGEKLDEIEDQMKITASRQYEFKLQFSELRFIGQGTIVQMSTREINCATFTRYFLTHLHINNRLHIDIQRSRFQLQAVA